MRRKTTSTLGTAVVLAIAFALIVLMSATCLADVNWTTNGVLVGELNAQVMEPRVITASDGGAIIAWYERQMGEWIIKAQKLDASGNALWYPGGIAVRGIRGSNAYNARLVSDGAGGAIIAWQDERDTPNINIYAQRVDQNGNTLWTGDGIPVRVLPSYSFSPEITSDGAGGAIICFIDQRNGPQDLYAQRVSGAGTMLWQINGVPVRVAANNVNAPQLVSDGANGAVITWQDERSGFAVYAQRIEGVNGGPAWTVNGVPVGNPGYSNFVPVIAAAGAAESVIAWGEYDGANQNIRAQKMSGAGAAELATYGVSICSGTGAYAVSPTIDTDSAGGAVIAWRDSRHAGSTSVFAQRVAADSNVRWTVNGVEICTSAGDNPWQKIVTDGGGGAYLTWLDARNSGDPMMGPFDVYAQSVLAEGTVQWAAGGVAIRVTDNTAGHPWLANNSSNGAYITWDDSRTGATGIYAQSISGARKPTLSGITPDHGINTGTVNVTDLSGTCFETGATVRLRKTGQTDIVATAVDVVSPTRITCSFDLNGKTTGNWLVFVTNPDGETNEMPLDFSVEYPAPQVTGIAPAHGYSGEILNGVQISGSNFRDVDMTAQLRRTGETITASRVTFVSANQVDADFTIPAAAVPGTPFTVVVRNNDDGKQGTLADGFAVERLHVNAGVSGGHGQVDPISQEVTWDEQATVDLEPDPNYHVVSITDNGVPKDIYNPYVIEEITEPHDVVVTYAIDQHAVTANVVGGGGTVIPGTQQIDYGSPASVDLQADPGYHVESILDNWSSMPITDPYNIPSVTEPHTVAVTFARDDVTVTAGVIAGLGTVAPTSQSVTYGQQASVTLNPDPNYHTYKINDNGVPQAITNPYVIDNVTVPHDVQVAYTIDTHAVTANVVGGHGTATPGTQDIPYGNAASINISPDPGYGVASILDNWSSMPVANPYNIASVTEPHTVVVTFAVSTPVIDSLSSSVGYVGSDITLNGSNFGATQGTSCVSFGTTQATVYGAWSDTAVIARVPAGLAGDAPVTITTTLGTSATKVFGVCPDITGVTPTYGNAGVTVVTLTGTSFGATQGTSSVWFGGSKATTYTSWSDSQVKVRVGAGAYGRVSIKLYIDGYASNAKAYDVRPNITAMSPTTGYQGFTQVTISGNAFGNSQGSSMVYFGGVPVQIVTSWKNTQLRVLVPIGSTGAVKVKVLTTGGNSNTKTFTVI